MNAPKGAFRPYSQSQLAQTAPKQQSRPRAVPLSSHTPPVSPHAARHTPQKQEKLVIPNATAEAPFGVDVNGRPLTATEFADARMAQTGHRPVGQIPQLPQAQPYAQTPAPDLYTPPQAQETIQVMRKYGEPVPLELPSLYMPYVGLFNALYVRPLRGYNMSLFARAWANKSKRQEVEAVSSVLEADTDLPLPPAFYLALGDYYWLLYRLRFTNYTRPIKHTDLCNSATHQNDVRDGKASRKSLIIDTMVTADMLEETQMTVMPMYDMEVMQDIALRPATMMDMVETMEHPNFGSAPEWDYLSQIACYIVGDTYEERIELARSMTPDQIEQLQKYETVLAGFGMKERVKVTCNHCGHSHISKVTIDASTFLPG